MFLWDGMRIKLPAWSTYLEDVVVVRHVEHPPLTAAAEDDLGLVRPALPSDRDGLVLGAVDLSFQRDEIT